jgi:CheY-like chemotaxis protein
MPSSGGRVLVVDDEPQVAAMLNAVLKTLGYSVQVAETGADGLRIVPGFRPDVVLLDMALPGIPGEIVVPVTNLIRAAEPNLPVTVVSTCGTGGPGHRSRTVRY